MTPSCSFVIPLYNSSHIDRQLSALARIRFGAIDAEFIFVDDGSDAGYLVRYERLFLDYQKNINIRFCSLGIKRGLNRVCLARNEGVRMSSSSNIIFLDQDSIPPASYLERLSSFFWRDEAIFGASLGYNNLPKSITEQQIESFILSGSISEKNFRDFRTEFPMGADLWRVFGASNTYIRKDVFLAVGWFDEQLTRWGDEDVDFGYRLSISGVGIRFIPEVCVLNLSEKLYRLPYRFLDTPHVRDITAQFAQNYRKHGSVVYKHYVLDRFSNLSLWFKRFVDPVFESEILGHSFYSRPELSKAPIFFRIDDVCELDQNFIQIVALLRSQNIPFILGVEPGNVTREVVDYILKMKQVGQVDFDIVQHGWRHVDYSQGSLQYEFGPSRSVSEKKQDLLDWYRAMKAYFGKYFFECFIPPYNFLDDDSQGIISELWIYKVISSGTPSIDFLGTTPIVSLPARVDMLASYAPSIRKSLGVILREFRFFAQRDGFVVFLLHPQHFSEELSLRSLVELIMCVRSDFSPMLFSQFYRNYWW